MEMFCVILVSSLAYGFSSRREEFQINELSEEDYCLSEIFQPRCLRNEVILMETAVYGRMRIGRCITAEEVEAVGARYLGCSADVLYILDRICSGKTECYIRVIEISDENIMPCVPGLSAYLEVNYSCITVVDERRSCTVDASKNPTHISFTQMACGTKYQPWIIEAPFGQKIIITLFSFVTGRLTNERAQICQRNGVIIDKIGKRNISICANERQRERELYLSAGNALDIILYSNFETDSSNYNSNMFILKLKAFGCANIITPEDSWMRRNGDTAVIGCYSSRITWHFFCEHDKWVGSFGNCTYAEGGISETTSDTETINDVNDQWRNTLIIVSIAMASIVIVLLIITCGVCTFTRLKASYLRQKAKAKGVKKKVTFARNSQDSVLNTRNPNIQPQPTAREIPTSHSRRAVTSSLPNIHSMEPGSSFHYLVPNDSNYESPYLDLDESFRRRTPIRSQEPNSTSGYLLPNDLRSQSRRHEYLDLVDYNTIHPSVRAPDTDPKSGYLVPNEFKPPSRAHDYLDLVDNPTLPRGRPHDSKCRYLVPKELRRQSRRHDYLDLIDYDPNHSSRRRRHSDPFSGYLVPNEFREQIYTNDYMHIAERELDRPSVYAFLRSASAAAPMPTNNQ